MATEAANEAFRRVGAAPVRGFAFAFTGLLAGGDSEVVGQLVIGQSVLKAGWFTSIGGIER